MNKFHSGGNVLGDYIVVLLFILTITDFGDDSMTNQTGFFITKILLSPCNILVLP